MSGSFDPSVGYQSQFDLFKQTEQQYITDNTPPGQPVPTFDAGGPTDLFTSGHAVIADMLGQDIYDAQTAAYLWSATGSDLDNKAADYNTFRKQAEAASSSNFQLFVNTASTQNATIAAGTIITTVPTLTQPAVQFKTTSDNQILAGASTLDVYAVCTTPGSIGNLPANTQLYIGSANVPMDGVTLTTDITNGVDTESDDSLRLRAQQAFRGVSIGTSAWYQAQVTSVSGITSATTVSGYQVVNGIAIYVAGPNNIIPNATTIETAQTKLDNSRPQIDIPTVIAGTPLAVNVTVDVVVAPGTSISDAQTSVENAISILIQAIPQGADGPVSGYNLSLTGAVYQTSFGNQITNQGGVLDWSNLQINGNSSSLVVDPSQTLQPGTITASVTTA